MLKRLIAFISLCFVCQNAAAEPYINTSDLTLKASIQHLKNSGLIEAPINTYPLLWADINRSLKKIKRHELSISQQASFDYINSILTRAPKKQLRLKVNAATNHKRFVSFGDNNHNKTSIGISASHVMDRIAYKLSPTFLSDAIDDDNFRLDDSYIAARIGNWNLAFGTQDRWWGPGWDSNIGLTNNARPIISASVSRNISYPVTIPFTDGYQIPWNVSSFMAKMENDRYVADTLLWGFRLSFIPIDNLEISLIRLAQWGGEGRSQSLGTFVDLLLGKDNCGVNGLDCGENSENEPGNQQAGFDFRYSFNLLDTPMSVYGQYFGEDGDASGGLNFITKPAIQVGFDGQLSLFNQPTTYFVEYSNTYKTCGTEQVIGDCFFEHHIYKTGMRYKKRNIGHLYDNDAESLVFGLIGSLENGYHWDLRYRYIEINKDNSDRYPNDEKGNTVSEVAENLGMMSANVSKQFFNQLSVKVGLDLSYSKFVENKKDRNIDFNLSLNYLF